MPGARRIVTPEIDALGAPAPALGAACRDPICGAPIGCLRPTFRIAPTHAQPTTKGKPVDVEA